MRGLTLAALLAGTTAQADIEVTFRDGAPKDRFTITNIGACASEELYLMIDLITAPAGLIFDVSAQGAGVEVFQPVEVTSGAQLVTFVSEVRDGDNRMTIVIAQLEAGGVVSFMADLDDTGGGRGITVSGSEIAGATAVLDNGVDLIEGVFDDNGRALIAQLPCQS